MRQKYESRPQVRLTVRDRVWERVQWVPIGSSREADRMDWSRTLLDIVTDTGVQEGLRPSWHQGRMCGGGCAPVAAASRVIHPQHAL